MVMEISMFFGKSHGNFIAFTRNFNFYIKYVYIKELYFDCMYFFYFMHLIVVSMRMAGKKYCLEIALPQSFYHLL